MNTQYLTLILRLRLDGRQSREAAGDKVYGSLQQVGLNDVHYFDSTEKLQTALQQLFDRVNLSCQSQLDD